MKPRATYYGEKCVYLIPREMIYLFNGKRIVAFCSLNKTPYGQEQTTEII